MVHHLSQNKERRWLHPPPPPPPQPTQALGKWSCGRECGERPGFGQEADSNEGGDGEEGLGQWGGGWGTGSISYWMWGTTE